MLAGKMRPAVVVETLSHFDQLFPSGKVARAGAVRTLARRREPFPDFQFEDHGRTFDLNDYLATNRVAGLLVLKDGTVAFENYELGIGSQTRWASCSIAKSIASTLLGAALKDGDIASLDDPVSRYVPALRSGGYETVSVRNVLMMASGVRWNETYTDPQSDRRRLLEVQLRMEPGGVLRHMSGLSRVAAPGSAWAYNTGESYVMGAIIEGATRRSLVDYLSEKIWSKAGMEQDATWWLESPEGMVFAGSGMSATLRDYGRFGQFVLDGGQLNGVQIVPDGWFAQAGAPQVIAGKVVDYGYMWWIPPQTDPMHIGAFQAEGVFGQFIYLNPRERLVIVVLSARPKPSVVSRVELTDETFFAAVARALQ